MNSTKRFKVGNILRWQPILGDDYLRTDFRLEPFMIADIIDNKQTSSILKHIQQVYPLPCHLKFKRIRSIQGSHLQILIAPRKDYQDLPDEFKAKVANIREIQLPSDTVLTRRQFEMVIKNFWPLNFHSDKRIESLVDMSFEKTDEKFLIRSDFYSRLVADLAQNFNSPAAALIVNPKNDKIVGSGIDERKIHPLGHSVISALKSVSKNQLDISNLKSSDHINQVLRLKGHIPEDLLATNFDKEEYLCTNFHVYLTHEPCSMCSMALMHARVAKIFFIFNTKFGYLKTLAKLHCKEDLNHSCEAFESRDLDVSEAWREYFFNLKTRHENLLNKYCC